MTIHVSIGASPKMQVFWQSMGNLWIVHGKFHDPCRLKIFSFGKSNLRFPLYQATVVLRYGQHPVGGSTSGHEIFKILIFNPPNKFKLEEKLLKEMPHFERTPSKNVSSLEHPLFCISLQIFRRIFQFNDPTVSPPASFLPSRYMPPPPATKIQSHPANPEIYLMGSAWGASKACQVSSDGIGAKAGFQMNSIDLVKCVLPIIQLLGVYLMLEPDRKANQFGTVLSIKWQIL